MVKVKLAAGAPFLIHMCSQKWSVWVSDLQCLGRQAVAMRSPTAKVLAAKVTAHVRIPFFYQPGEGPDEIFW